ncbi:Rossmann-fold NAD(P)-binding domain-containing protein [Streptomyces flaveolus]|uniref:hypothetical protein n=1 Tax=Streptomyces flaveolus TaxID=67297 RepID=UPI003701811E
MSRSSLITSGSRSTGIAITRHVAEPGRRIVANYRPVLLAVHRDITKQADAIPKKVEEQQSPVERLVANAGITKRASRRTIRAKESRVEYISTAVTLCGENGQSAYAVSKASRGLARSAACEFGRLQGNTSNAISP